MAEEDDIATPIGPMDIGPSQPFFHKCKAAIAFSLAEDAVVVSKMHHKYAKYMPLHETILAILAKHGCARITLDKLHRYISLQIDEVSGRIVVGALDKKTGELFAIVINAEKLVFTNVDCETGIKVCGLVVGRGRLFVVCNDRVRIYRLQREDGMPLDCEVMIRSIDHNLSDVWTHGVIIEDSKDVLLLTRPTTLSSKTGQKGKVSIVAAQERTDGVLVYRKGNAMHATYLPSELSPSGNNGRIALCRRGICIMCTAEKLCREPRIDEKEAFQIDAATVIASLLQAQYTSKYSTAAVDAESPSMTTHSFQGQLGVLISRPSGQLAICCVDVFQDQLLVVFTQTIIAPSGEEKMVADMIAVKGSSRADDNPRTHTFAGRRLTRENVKPDYIRVRDDQIALHFAHSPVLEYYSAETFTVQSF